MSAAARLSSFAARLDRAAESGQEAADLVIQEANAVRHALELECELARERAAHAQTMRSLARAYDVIAKMRQVLGMGAS